MAIVNRDLGTSQQRQELDFVTNSATATGVTLLGPIISSPCNLEAVAVAALGLSGAPEYSFSVLRYSAAGLTAIALGVSNIVIAAAAGASGSAQGWSGIAVGTTLCQLQRGDMLSIVSAGANTAAAKLAVKFVVRKTEDIVSALGLAT